MARGATAAARRPAERRARTERSRTGGAGPLPRRVSGPAPTAGAAVVALPGRVLRTPLARVARTRGSSLLDALLRGRVWIGLVGLLLVGIVFFNVDLLRLNREIAQTSERVSTLKRDNGSLLLEVARLDSSERLQEAAARQGFVLPAPGDVRYLRARPGRDARVAAARITTPRDGAAATTQPSGSSPAPAAQANSQPGALAGGQPSTTQQQQPPATAQAPATPAGSQAGTAQSAPAPAAPPAPASGAP